MRKIANAFMTLLIFAAPVAAHAHGEDKPGPHGGVIRMPGGFHTEVVAQSGGIEVFLLDVSLQNPSVDGSSLQASLERGGESRSLQCETKNRSYFCNYPAGDHAGEGKLTIKAKRGKNGVPGEAVYSLPLTVKSTPR